MQNTFNINKVTYTYDDGSDDHSIMNGFEAGTYTSASIRGTWSTEEFNKYMDKYKDNVYIPMTDGGTFSWHSTITVVHSTTQTRQQMLKGKHT